MLLVCSRLPRSCGVSEIGIANSTLRRSRRAEGRWFESTAAHSITKRQGRFVEVAWPRLLKPPMLKTFTTSRREYILIAAIVLATVAAVVIPFAWDTAASVQYLESSGLTATNNPIDLATTPVVFAAIACILLLATSGLLLTLPRAAARRIAIIGAGAESVISFGLGAAGLLSAFIHAPNTDALEGLALLVVSQPLLAGGIAYLGVTLLIRSQRPGWE